MIRLYRRRRKRGRNKERDGETARKREINCFVSCHIAGGQINLLVTLLLGVPRAIYTSMCVFGVWWVVCLSRHIIKHILLNTKHSNNNKTPKFLLLSLQLIINPWLKFRF